MDRLRQVCYTAEGLCGLFKKHKDLLWSFERKCRGLSNST